MGRNLPGRLVLCAVGCIWSGSFGAETPRPPSWGLVLVRDPAWNVTLDLSQPPVHSHQARLTNLSIRAMPTRTLTGTAVVQGTGSLPLLVRGVGPGLERLGVTNNTSGLWLSVYHDRDLLAQTNHPLASTFGTAAYVGAFPISNPVLPGIGDAAIVGRAKAGKLVAEFDPFSRAPSVGLLEFYEASADPTMSFARFVAFSTETTVAPGEGVLVLGFVVRGEGEITLLLRAIGPRPASNDPRLVTPSDQPATYIDPIIELHSGSTFVVGNDGWRSDPKSADDVQAASSSVGASALANDENAALLVSVPAGAYTLQIRDAAGRSGLVLAEIHELPRTMSTGGPGTTATTGAASANRDFDPAEAANAMGLELYRRLAAGMPRENLALSPYSIETALALAYAGADGVTRREMAEVLRFPDDNAILQAGLANVRDALTALVGESKKIADARTVAGKPTAPIQWHAANRLFGQVNYPFRAAFVDLMREGFAAPLAEVDFRLNFESARLAINRWVEEETRQKILDLVPPGGVDAATRLALVNALYLNAPWEKPFAKEDTALRPFYPAPDTSRSVPTMTATVPGAYAVEDGLELIGVDYLGGGLRLLVILPDEDQTVDTIAARVTAAHFTRWARLAGDQLKLYLPKFKIRGETVALSGPFQDMGMKTAFDVPAGSANFDRMAPRKPTDYLAISNIFHQAYIALDEEGTEAAAATAVVLVPTVSAYIPPREVHIDRPFLFAIQHRASGTCLFLGRVMDPQ